MLPGPKLSDPVVRFWAKVEKSDDPAGCWQWLGSTKSSQGYGNFYVQRSPGDWYPMRAHRFAYELLVGSVPDGLQLDHLCRNRACVNPAHLEPVTNRENGLRGEGVAAQHARKTHCVNGHEFTAENTRLRPKPWGTFARSCRTCDAIFNERRQAIRRAETAAYREAQHRSAA